MNNTNMIDLTWFNTLNKPVINIPEKIFTPIWIVLYAMIFFAFFLYIHKRTWQNKFYGLLLFLSQLILNICWVPAFFVLHNIKLALIIIIVLDILVLLTITEFFKISKPSAFCLIPYFVWIIFATYLNIQYALLN